MDTYNDHLILVPGIIVHIVQIGIGIALIFSFPVLAFELRHCVDALFFPHSNFRCARARSPGFAVRVCLHCGRSCNSCVCLWHRVRRRSWVRHTLENVCIIAIALAVGILVPVVVTVFGFIGATTSSAFRLVCLFCSVPVLCGSCGAGCAWH